MFAVTALESDLLSSLNLGSTAVFRLGSKIDIGALNSSHTVARHTHFLAEECHLPVSAIRQIYGVVLLFAYWLKLQ